MGEFEDLKRMLKSELEKITKKGDLSPNELDNATKVVCLLEKIGKVEEIDMEMMNSQGYSERYYPQMPPANSYARRRDSMGRYSGEPNHYPEYSGHGYKEHMVKRLEMMMEEAPTEHERGIIAEAISKLER